MSGTAKKKVLIAKPGLDGHDVGAKVVVRALMDAGYEVVYTGLHQTPEAIVDRFRELDGDVLGLSILSGTHLPLCKRISDLLKQYGLADRLWMVGGNIPHDDRPALTGMGFRGVFPTASKLSEIVAFLEAELVQGEGAQ